MTSAVYVVSPRDNVKAFAATSREFEYDGRAVHVGGMVEEVRSVVFADSARANSAAAILRQAIASGESFEDALKTFKMRIAGLLAFFHLESENLRVFVHFIGQGEAEVRQFNKALGQTSMNTGSFKCYAISFGNYSPYVLFPNNVFTPPHGKSFIEMCDGLRSEEGDFGNIRALRLLLSCTTPNEKGEFDVSEAWWNLRNSSATKISNGERRFLADNTQLAGLLQVNNCGFLSFGRTIVGEEEFMRILSILERTEVKK